MNEHKNANRKLVDISTVNVDKNLPQSERSKDFKKQLIVIALYECEGFTIHAKYATNGDKMEDCLRGMKA